MTDSHTEEQAAIVRRVMQHNETDYYKILDIDKNASDADVKKGYRTVR